MADEVRLTPIRDKDWAFNVLWGACLDKDNDSIRCKVNIPETFIFRDGIPIKAIGTNIENGCVKRLMFENDMNITVNNYINNELINGDVLPTDTVFRDEIYRDIRILRKILVDFSINNGYDKFQLNIHDDYHLICMVIYCDGSFEELSLHKFDILMTNDTWRNQVLFLQSYIPDNKPLEEHYNLAQLLDEKDRNEIVKRSIAHDVLQSLVKFSAKAYSLYTDNIMEKIKLKPIKKYSDTSSITSDKASIESKESDNKFLKFKVHEMSAKFRIDPNGKLFFLFTEYVGVALEHNRKEVEDFINIEKKSRITTAAHSIAKELLALMKHGQRRGLSAKDSFDHFDKFGNGYIDADLLVEGCSTLGIGITYPVSVAVIQCIGGVGVKYITLHDMEIFMSKSVDKLTLEFTIENESLNKKPKKKKLKNGKIIEDEIVEVKDLSLKASQVVIITREDIKAAKVKKNKERKLVFNTQKRRAARKELIQFNDKNENHIAKIVKTTVFGPTFKDKDGEDTKLTSVYKQMNWHLHKLLDELLNCGEGIIMTYRLISNEINEESELSMNGKGFILVVIPDLFMTLEAMYRQIKDLLISYPYAKIVLVGLPGMPNTVYPEGWILNADLHSKCIAKLLDYLQTKGKFKDEDPVFFMGFGSGVYYLSKFISEIAPDIGWLKTRIKVIFIINGMLKFNKTYQQLCKELRQAMLSSDSFEVYQLVSSLHFYDDYLENNGADEMLKVFWSLRKELCADSVEVKFAGKGYIGVLEQLKLIYNNKDTFDGASILQTSIPIVVIQSTEDVFVTPQHTSMYQSDNLPPERFLVNKTSECLIPGAIYLNWLKAGHEVLQERTPFILGLISNIAQLCDIKPVAIDRVIKKDHNIFIDNDAFDVISLAFQLKQNHEDTLSTNEKNRLQAIEDEKEQRKKDAIEKAERLRKEKEEFEIEQLRKIAEEEARILDIKNKAIEAQRLLDEAEASKKQDIELERKRIAMEEDKKRREAKAARIAAMKKIQEETKFYEAEKFRERNETNFMSLEDEHCRQRQLYEVLLDLAERKKDAIEKNRLRLIAEEDALKQLAIQMKERMEVRRQKFNNLLQDISEYSEIMGKNVDTFDDNVSTLHIGESMTISTHKFTNDSMVETKLSIMDENATINSELNYSKDSNTVDSSDISTENNFSMNFSVIKQGEDGDDTVFNTVNDELQQQSSNISTNEVEYDKFADSNIVAKQIALAFNKMSEIWYIRCNHVECLIRENSIGYDLTNFNKVVESAEIDASRLRRAISLIAINPSLVGANTLEEVEGEIADLNRTLEQKENHLRNLKDRQATRKHHITKLKNHSNEMLEKMNELKNELDVIILHMLKLDSKLTAKTRKLKMEKEQLLSKRENVRFMQLISQQKLDLIKKEIERLKTHTHKYVDSSVIVTGLTQRSKTVELKKYLETVLHIEQNVLEKAKFDVEKLSIKILNQTDLILIGQRDNKKLFDVTKDLKAHLVRFNSQSSQDIATGHESSLKDCIAVVKRRNNNSQISKIASSLGIVDNISLIRIKDFELRTKDERVFIGFDIIMNPELYQHLTDIDREQMRFDKNYHSELSKSDLERILKLPSQISLVLPFLHSFEEIEAHRILNFFYRQLTDKVFQEKDYSSEGALIDNDGDTVETSLVSKVTEGGKVISNLYTFDSLCENDTMMKESGRHFIRCKEVGYELEIDERAWLQLDEELCRYIFEPTERSQRTKLGFPIDKTWKCPFDKNTLRAIWKADKDVPNYESIIPAGTLLEDAIYCRRLIDKYYVDDEESTIGQQRIIALHDLSSKIMKIMKLHDNSLKDQIDFTRQEVQTIQENIFSGLKKNENEDSLIKRIWGSWEEVHPACYGKESQSSYFMSSSFDATRDNPAAFAIHSDSFFDDKDDVPFQHEELPTDPFELRKLGVKILTSFPGHSNFGNSSKSNKNDPNSKWSLFSSIRELSVQDPRKLKGKTILISKKDPYTLLNVTHAKLLTGQSRSHRFFVPNKDDSRILNITVSIIFQGEFVRKGYSPARVAAALFRIPDSKDPHAPLTPQPVGYSPYFMQSPNLPESLGKLTIIHRPRARPLKSGMFQLVIGCAADSNYSIQIMGECAQVALPIIDEQIAIAKQKQLKLTSVLLEIDTIKETIELAKFKQELCLKMIKEAEAESSRTHKGLIKAQKEIELDNEEMTMFDAERKQTEKELKVFEKDYGYWSRVFSSRAREKQDIDTGVTSLNDLLITKLEERNKIKDELNDARSDLPACFSILRSFAEATQIATLLNTTMNTDLYQGTGNNIPIVLKTPAEDLRSRMKLEGFKNLITEEQQWIVLDQSLNPSKYDWLREKEEADAMEYEALGKKPEVVKLDPSIAQYKIAKIEIEHIMKSPFSMLNRTEMIVRKLISKYHDDPKKIKDLSAGPVIGFDAHLADRVRNKNPLTYTKEEVEWISIDQILHPDIWKYYVKYDEGICIDKDKAASNIDGYKRVKQRKVSKDDPGNRLDSNKVDTVNKLSNLLGHSSLLNEANDAMTTKLDLNSLTNNARKQILEKKSETPPWICTWTKDAIFSVWRTPRHKLKNEEQRNALRLLLKYNGLYGTYIASLEESEQRKMGAHKIGNNIRWDAIVNAPSKDTDLRARLIMREIERGKQSVNPSMVTQVLAGFDQKFPTSTLIPHLKEELENILGNQIKDRELAERFLLDSSDSESDNSDEISNDDVEGEGIGPEMALRLQKRALKKEKQAIKENGGAEVVKKNDKKVDLKSKKGKALADAILQNELGGGGCLACRSNPCKWYSTVDEDIVLTRLHVLDDELIRVRSDKESASFESSVCLSAQLGGNKFFRRIDLLEELTNEQFELKRVVELNNVDRELHDCYATRSEYVTVVHLHGYPMQLWTNNARLAMEARQNRLVAQITAKEIADDILDWMLEGWYFGERESDYNVLGYVPSIKKDGKIKSGQDQIRSIAEAASKMKKRMDAKKANIILPEAHRGLMLDKAMPIEASVQKRLKNEVKEHAKKQHKHLLDETETTMRFGIFMMTLMYFRVMTLLRREKASWSGEGDDIGVKSKQNAKKAMTDERMRMLDEENKMISRKKRVDDATERCRRGERKKSDREKLLRKEAVLKKVAYETRQKLLKDSVSNIQRIYRGFIGRKNAYAWAMKRADLGALTNVMHMTATCIQRYYRGYLGRVYKYHTRMEMSNFIAYVRVQELKADDEQYWKTHPWSRYKRDHKEWMDKKFRNAADVKALGGDRSSDDEDKESSSDNDSDVDSESSGQNNNENSDNSNDLD